MIDLTKIDKPFGELDDATKGALLLARYNGESIECLLTGGWRKICVSPFPFHRDTAYRLAPKPLTKPSIDWSIFGPLIVCIFVCENGNAYAATKVPEIRSDMWWWSSDVTFLNNLASYTPGTCDWRDSVVFRPEKETP